MTLFMRDQENLRQGIEKGRKEGREEGRKEGLEEGLFASLKNLIANTGMSIEQAMSVLAIPDSDRAKYAEMLKG